MKHYLTVVYAAALVSAANPFLLGRDSCAGNDPSSGRGHSGDTRRQTPSLQSSAPTSTRQPSTTTQHAAPNDAPLASTTTLGNEITTTLTLTLARPEASSAEGERTVPQDDGPPVHVVDVGSDAGASFKPNHLNAAVGDIVRFNFGQRNQTLTQSSLDLPCTENAQFHLPADFGPLNVTGALSVELEVQGPEPQWFYRKHASPVRRCGSGSVFAINPGDNFAVFLQNADQQGQARVRDRTMLRRRAGLYRLSTP